MKILKKVLLSGSVFTLFLSNFLYANNLNPGELQKMMTPEMQKKASFFLQNLDPNSKMKMLQLGLNVFNTYLRKNMKLFSNSDFFIKKAVIDHNVGGYFLNFIVVIKNPQTINSLTNLQLSKLHKKMNMLTSVLNVGVEYSFYSQNGRFLFKKVAEYPKNY